LFLKEARLDELVSESFTSVGFLREASPLALPSERESGSFGKLARAGELRSTSKSSLTSESEARIHRTHDVSLYERRTFHKAPASFRDMRSRL